MEFRDDAERYEHGVLGRECEAALAVAAMQQLIVIPDTTEPPELAT